MRDHTAGEAEMSDDIVFEDVTPVIPVLDLAAALERYRRLGFKVRAYGHGTGYGYADRGPRVASSERVGLSTIQSEPRRSCTYTCRTQLRCIPEWAGAGVEGRFGEIRETQYGMREFGYVDPDGTLHRVGSRLLNPAIGLSRHGTAPSPPFSERCRSWRGFGIPITSRLCTEENCWNDRQIPMVSWSPPPIRRPAPVRPSGSA